MIASANPRTKSIIKSDPALIPLLHVLCIALISLSFANVFPQLKMDGVKRDEKATPLVDDRQEHSVKVRIHVAEG
jgi:hypothetical protein